jgi:signal transduction histidine kinase
MGSRIPVLSMRRPEKRVLAGAVGFVAACLIIAAAASWVVYGHKAALEVVEILGPVGLAMVAITTLLVRGRHALGGLRRQFSITAALVFFQLLAAVGLFALLMFGSNEDAFFTALVAVFAGFVGICSARVLARSVLGDVDRLRDAVDRIRQGERAVTIATSGGDELELIAHDIERMARQLDIEERATAAAEQAHRDLLAAVSHDLRTPITSLRLLADALDDDLVDDATRREYVSRIGTHVRALSALIDDLFELSRLRAGEFRWTMERVHVADLVRETVDAMRPQADAKALIVRADVADAAHYAQANPEKIQRVLFNLIQNAIHNTPSDGSITVRAESSGDLLELEVADTGIGIPASDRERVFEPFFQCGKHPTRSNGSAGLGLAISRAIVEAHGGRIWLVDAPAGTCVRFSLPRAGLSPA